MIKILLQLIICPLLFGSAYAQAELTIKITEGIESPVPMAIVPFGWNQPGKAPEDLAAIIASDLERSGRFTTLDRAHMLIRPSSPSQIRFRNWQTLGMESLVIGQIRDSGPGKYIVTFQLFDVFRGEQLTGYTIPLTAREFRHTAHKIADIIYQKLTGEAGVFSTHIAYITRDVSIKGATVYRLQVADADGQNAQTMARSKEPIMSPAWAPDGARIAYVSFESGKPAIYIQELNNGRRRKLARYNGINGAPAWSPDGRKLALTLSKDGNPDIFVLDLASKKLRKITSSFAIDTEPQWSPDGKYIIFTSDRGGKPQIYITPSMGGPSRRLSFDGNYNAGASISPDGKSVAMVHASDGNYRIAVLDLESRKIRILTPGKLDESPSFAPNGSMLLYAARKGGQAILSAVSFDGRMHQNLQVKSGEVREPAWSPK